jgi:uncharacterized protein DUF4190/uncharacterized protein DUF4339
MNIFVHRNGQQLGPFSESDIRAQLVSGAISAADLVWWEGQAGWIPLSQSPYAAAPAVTAAPPPVSVPASSPAVLAKQKTSGLALASLVTGIVGTMTCGTLLLFIPAIILGHLGLRATKNPAVQGRGLAIAGLVLGYVQLVLGIIVLLIFSAPILALIGLGAMANAQTQISSGMPGTTPLATNSDSITNGPDISTNSTPTTAPSDNSSTPATNSPDSSAPATNSPDTNSPATNAAPANQ